MGGYKRVSAKTRIRVEDALHVLSDDADSSRLAVNRLLSLGHRRIAFVGGVAGISCFHERLRGYREALEGASVAFDERLVRRIETRSLRLATLS